MVNYTILCLVRTGTLLPFSQSKKLRETSLKSSWETRGGPTKEAERDSANRQWPEAKQGCGGPVTDLLLKQQGDSGQGLQFSEYQFPLL